MFTAPLVIVGAGGLAREVVWLVDQINLNAREKGLSGVFSIQGLVAPAQEGEPPAGLPVLGDDTWAIENLDKSTKIAVALGSGALRLKVADRYEKAGFHLTTLIDPGANISGITEIGPGTIILPGVTFTVNIRLGRLVLLNPQVAISHDCTLEDGVSIGPGAVCAGNVTVQRESEIGAGAVVIPKCKVGPESIIGAGAVVTGDLKGKTTYVGVPARPIST